MPTYPWTSPACRALQVPLLALIPAGAKMKTPLKELVCAICHEDLLTDQGGAELGELDCCSHRWASGGGRLLLLLLPSPPFLGHSSFRHPSSATLAPHVAGRRFCFPCISKWAEIENSCPSCRARFAALRRKRLPPRRALLGIDANGELPGTYLADQAVEERNQVGPGGLLQR